MSINRSGKSDRAASLSLRGMGGEGVDLRKLRVSPLSDRKSLTRIEDILVDPDSTPKPCAPEQLAAIESAAQSVAASANQGASIMLIYGAHLVRNGAALILDRMMERGWFTHLATNGAGTIHDWEYSYLGKSTESVEENVAAGNFGSWDETGKCIHLALMSGALSHLGYGAALGEFIADDGTEIPAANDLERLIREEPASELTPARADFLQAILAHKLPQGPMRISHPWKQSSLLYLAYRRGVPLTVHPGIGYDIISNHPMFSGAAIGRAAEIDFRSFVNSVEGLDGGTVLSIGSAIMGPQVFEKSLSCVHNLRFQQGRPAVCGHKIFVVDLQDGGKWDWRAGEPPKTNPAYYLRFCKSFSRMGGEMQYTCCDNLQFVHHLYHQLKSLS